MSFSSSTLNAELVGAGMTVLAGNGFHCFGIHPHSQLSRRSAVDRPTSTVMAHERGVATAQRRNGATDLCPSGTGIVAPAMIIFQLQVIGPGALKARLLSLSPEEPTAEQAG